jgi:hypothetical protein
VVERTHDLVASSRGVGGIRPVFDPVPLADGAPPRRVEGRGSGLWGCDFR